MNRGDTQKTVFVGLSGGVDSSVAALRLKKAGYEVVGVFIKVWHPDFLECDEERDRLDAMRVAAHLEIPFLTFDAADRYKKDVADYMIVEYKAGRTPNPDVMCNKHVKFGAFLDFARANGADYVATGHYARKLEVESGKLKDAQYKLLQGADGTKDQSYFLWTLTQDQLAHVLFPIGDSLKEDIRKEAAAAGLPTARKRDSQGICFLGKVDMKEFLSHYVSQKSGDVLDEEGSAVGRHDGALFYTIGQRHGFVLNNTDTERSPHYVVAKDMDVNTITVSAVPPRTMGGTIELRDLNEIQPLADGEELLAQFRYRQTPVRVKIGKKIQKPQINIKNDGNNKSYSNVLKNIRIAIELLEETDLPSSGQSCVLYRGDECVGGGIIV